MGITNERRETVGSWFGKISLHIDKFDTKFGNVSNVADDGISIDNFSCNMNVEAIGLGVSKLIGGIVARADTRFLLGAEKPLYLPYARALHGHRSLAATRLEKRFARSFMKISAAPLSRSPTYQETASWRCHVEQVEAVFDRGEARLRHWNRVAGLSPGRH
jgi:hypothetical protein